MYPRFMQLRLDDVDVMIATLLQGNAKLTHAAIAGHVNLSPSACLRRIRRLESNGLITGYHARLNRALTQQSTTVFVEVSLSQLDEEARDEFETAVARVGQIVNCHFVAAEFDYYLQVWTDGTAGYEALHREVLTKLPYVVSVRSRIALRTILERGARLERPEI